LKIRVHHVLWVLLFVFSIVAVLVSGRRFSTNFALNGTPTTQIPSIIVPFGTLAVIAVIEYGRRKVTIPFGEQIFNVLLTVFLFILLFLVAQNSNHHILRTFT
jgi:hypothetical protein